MKRTGVGRLTEFMRKATRAVVVYEGSREEMSETKRYASVAKDVGSDGTTYLSHTVDDTRPENVRQNEKVVRRPKSIEIDAWRCARIVMVCSGPSSSLSPPFPTATTVFAHR